MEMGRERLKDRMKCRRGGRAAKDIFVQIVRQLFRLRLSAVMAAGWMRNSRKILAASVLIHAHSCGGNSAEIPRPAVIFAGGSRRCR